MSNILPDFDPNAEDANLDLAAAIRKEYPNDDEYYEVVNKVKRAILAICPEHASPPYTIPPTGEVINRPLPLWALSDRLSLSDLKNLLTII